MISSPRFVLSSLALGLLSAPMLSQAAAIERSGQSILPIFEKGNYAEVSYVFVDPSLPGTVNGTDIDGDSADNYGYLSGAVKLAPSDDSFIALIYDEPFGLDYDYGSQPILGGAEAELNSQNYTLLVGGKPVENVWLYGGVAYQHIDANVTTPNIAPYNLDFSDNAGGLVVGAAYEIPEIALRAAVTYRSEIENKGTATENVLTPGGPLSLETPFEISTPQSVNLNFQTGVTPTTLFMLDLRWVDWTAFKAAPQAFTAGNAGEPLVSFDKDQYSGTIGVGQKLTDNLSASLKFAYDSGTGENPSIFGPYEEKYTTVLGAKYSIKNVDLSAAAAYTWLGSAEVPVGPFTAEYDDGDALAFAAKVGYHF